MRRIADVGAAVIGTGFIGTVHVEALRRIGVQVHGVLGSTPERGAARAQSLGVPRAYDSLGDLLRDPRVEVVHVTSPNDLHLPQTLAILAAGRHVVCEKPLAMSASESRQLVDAAAASGLVNAANFNIRYYPLNQHAHEVVTGGDIGDVRLVTGRYFQDWLLLDSDWNWRLEPDRGGALRAVGDIGSHWLDLMTFVTGQRVVAVMADLATFIEARREPTGPVETFSTDVAAETVTRQIATEDAATILLRFDERRPRRGQHQPDQCRPEELAPVRDRRFDLLDRLGFGAARPDLARPSRTPERDPDQEPGPDGPAGRAAAALPGGHVEGFGDTFAAHFRAVYADVAAGGPSARPDVSDLRRRSRRDAGQRRHRRKRPDRALGRRRSRPRPGRHGDQEARIR